MLRTAMKRLFAQRPRRKPARLSAPPRYAEFLDVRTLLTGFPTVDANGPYEFSVDTPLTLQGTINLDDPTGESPVTETGWDVNGDSIIDLPGDSVTLTWSQLTSQFGVTPGSTWAVSFFASGPTGGASATTTAMAWDDVGPVACPAAIVMYAGEDLLLDGTASFDSVGRIRSWDWVVEGANGQSYSTSGETVAVPWSALKAIGWDAENSYTITLTVNDGFNPADSSQIVVWIGALAPHALITIPDDGYAPGSSITFDASQSHDRDDDGQIVEYEWQLTTSYDAAGATWTDEFSGTTTGPTWTVPWATLAAHHMPRRGSFQLRLKVTDNHGLTDETEDTLAPIAPIVTITPLADIREPIGIPAAEPVAAFQITRQDILTEPLAVSIIAPGGTADTGDDYQPISTSFTFQPGESSIPINVVALNDFKVEDPESLSLTLAQSGDYRVAGTGIASVDCLSNDRWEWVSHAFTDFNTLYSGSVWSGLGSTVAEYNVDYDLVVGTDFIDFDIDGILEVWRSNDSGFYLSDTNSLNSDHRLDFVFDPKTGDIVQRPSNASLGVATILNESSDDFEIKGRLEQQSLTFNDRNKGLLVRCLMGMSYGGTVTYTAGGGVEVGVPGRSPLKATFFGQMSTTSAYGTSRTGERTAFFETILVEFPI